MLDHTQENSLAGEQSSGPRRLPPVPLSYPRRASRPLPKIPGPLACKKCHTCITSTRVHLPPSSYPPDSRAFSGFFGKASLFTETYNVKLGRPSVQLMVTGAHTMQEISCSQCDVYLGWKIVRAHEHPERWKEGNCLLELERIYALEDDIRGPRSARDESSSDTDSDWSFEHINA